MKIIALEDEKNTQSNNEIIHKPRKSNILRRVLCEDDPLATIRLPQRGISCILKITNTPFNLVFVEIIS